MKASDLKPASSFARNFGVKMLAYGPPGSGKTPIINTAPSPVLLICEPGMLSMKKSNVPSWAGHDMKTVDEFMKWLTESSEAKKFDTIAIDSVSQMAEMCLAYELGRNKDPRKAYGNMSNWVMGHMSSLYFLQNKHAYLIAKEERIETGDSLMTKPYFPGQDLRVKVPHLYDLIARIALETIPGLAQKKTAIRCRESFSHNARDRSNTLDELEPPDLTYLFKKVMNN